MPRKGEDDTLNDRTRCIHMLDAAAQAVEFAAGRARGDLETDHMLRRALKDCVQEIGEAAARITDEGRDRVPDIPWTKIVGMRHILVHAYYNVENDTIWKVVVNDLPELILHLRAALDDWPE